MTAEFRFKIVMLGDGAVGKTAMTTRFTQNSFDSDYKRTIGADFAVKRMVIPDIDAHVTLQCWDLAGQPRFEFVRQGFYRGARGGLLLYDVTRRRTFLNIDRWKEESFTNVGREIPLVVVANKIDLVESRAVTKKERQAYAKENGFIYVESSALTGENVEEAYVDLCKRMIKESQSPPKEPAF
ncbi:MAG: GTP-binding protein [Candidatus Thorarchaeota archaeon]|nr:MAG: GTP-binding protein [Candidatus Thorarchaeota archaeon]